MDFCECYAFLYEEFGCFTKQMQHFQVIVDAILLVRIFNSYED